ncbi:hypothetical protein HY310_02725 [Candidatus Microgenomates bacterium]|nr:hypothetical protein [Candidatus Microgenomates bacterium]
MSVDNKNIPGIGKTFKESLLLYKKTLKKSWLIFFIVAALTVVNYVIVASKSFHLQNFLFSLLIVFLIVFLGYVYIAIVGGAAKNFKEAIKFVFNKLPKILWTGFLSMFLMWGAFYLMFFPLLAFSIWFEFASFTVLLENKYGFEALLLSREYTRGFFGKIFKRRLVIGSLLSVPLLLL